MKSLMSCKHELKSDNLLIQQVSKSVYSTRITLVGSVESSRSSWLMIASALKSLTCAQFDKVS